MRGPKYHQFVLLLSYLKNKNQNNKNTPLWPEPLRWMGDINLPFVSSTPLGKDSWLTGFIEADGSFQVRKSINTKYLEFLLVLS
jgi:hypothetical protein